MDSQNSTKQYFHLILNENIRLADKVNEEELDALIKYIKNAGKVFVMGTGRSGLALKMAAMRFMHLGLNMQIVGDTLTTSIQANDLLITASGSGATSSVINVAEKAIKQKAKVIAITADPHSKLAKLADKIVYLPAAVKTDFGQSNSAQYAGSLFEEFLVVLFESVFMVLWKDSGLSKEELWPRHANLE